MKIAMIHTPLRGRGGGERQILRLAIELQKFGHEVEIFTSSINKEKCYPEMLEKVKVNVVPHPLIPFRSLGGFSSQDAQKMLNVRASLRKIVGRQFYTSELISMIHIGRNLPKGFDIINIHNYPTEWAAFIAKKRLKIPVVWMCNEPPFWFFIPEQKEKMRVINWPLFEVLDKLTVKYIDAIIVLSYIAAGLVKKIYKRTSIVVRSGVDVELFHNASGEEIRKKHCLENDLVLLHVGNLDPIRKQSDSIQALYYLSKDYKNVKLILDGAGERHSLLKLSEKLGVKDKILFLHTKTDAELAKIYAACDLFIFPSQITWGLAVIEAMAAAKAVIVSKECGASEIIQNGVNGMVVDHAKPKDIARQVKMLIDDAELRKKIGENAYKYVQRNLSWEKYAKNMETIFRRVIKFQKSCDDISRSTY